MNPTFETPSQPAASHSGLRLRTVDGVLPGRHQSLDDAVEVGRDLREAFHVIDRTGRTVHSEPAPDTLPCAYCGAPVAHWRQVGSAWRWPGKGRVTVCETCGHDHPARPDDLPAPGDRCRDCGQPITWIGPSSTDWIHVHTTTDSESAPPGAG